jgi:hypothetical protein
MNERGREDNNMNDKRVRRHCSRPRLIIGATLALLMCAALFVYARASREARSAYALANDLPRGALVYAQCADLPALVKRWHESPLKQQLLGSTALQQFAHRHLALKLADRWAEYNDAFGFTVDADALAGATANRAAIAIYDIGRLDLVLVAPLSAEQRAAALFFAHTDNFEEVALPDGTTYFRREADVDNGRERQMLTFAWARGRFVLATNERLLLRTLANIEGRAHKDRLADEPAFQTLSRELVPHFATVWVDQAALNRDWYFKNYWVQRNVADLQPLRAGLFDLELQTGKWIERRRFLLTGQATAQPASLPATDAQRLSALLPADAAYYKVRALADATSAAALLSDTLLERAPQHDGSARAQNWNWRAYDDSDFEIANEADRYESSYAYLDQSYDRLIDDPVDARLVANDSYYDGELRAATEQQLVAELQQALAPARPLYVATAASPQTNSSPLFVEFRSVAALTLAAPGQFDRAAFERALARLAQSRLTIAGPAAELQWTDGASGSERWRVLTLPMLGRQLCYAMSGRELIVSNSPDLLQASLAAQARPQTDNATHAVAGAAALDELIVVRLTARRQAFDQVFARLDAERVKAYWTEHRGASDESQPPGPSQEFFSGTVASLLDVAAHVRTVEIRRVHHADRLQEEVEFGLD